MPIPLAVTWWLLFALVMTAIVFGHDGRHIVQLGALALPGLLCLRWPLRGAATRRMRTIFVSAWILAFVMDGVVRAYLDNSYRAAPDSSMVVTALANATSRETIEYLTMYIRPISGGIGGALLVCVFGFFLVKQLEQQNAPVTPTRGVKVVLFLGWLLSALAYANKPTRADHPFVFWPKLAISVDTLRLSWQDLEESRTSDLKRAKSIAPTVTSSAASNIVLVITDSVNRDNLSTHGYARATSPLLQEQLMRLNGDLVNVRNAWSVAAATLPSFDRMFQFDAQSPAAGSRKIHLLALARAAGYHVFWISNHDDLGVQQLHALFADELQLINRVPGRSTRAPDELCVEPLKAALADAHPRKLIVVHLLGAHPHYRLRFPDSENVFAAPADSVVDDMQRQGRSRWVIDSRNEYDAALRHHDVLINDTLNLTRQALPKGGHGAWLYLSDHGQEVGHVGNHAGHSDSTESGYRIPMFIWDSRGIDNPANMLNARPFRADWLAWTLTGLMGINWMGRTNDRDVLSPTYHFEPPRLNITVDAFAH